MTNHLSEHARAPIRQLGLREQDLAVILDAGTSLDTDGVLLPNEDVKRAVRRGEHEIAELERLCSANVTGGGRRTNLMRLSCVQARQRRPRLLYRICLSAIFQMSLIARWVKKEVRRWGG